MYDPAARVMPVRCFLTAGLLLCFATLACSQREIGFPAELAGRYETSKAKYSDRYLELSATHLVLGLGKNKSETFRIQNVYSEEEPDGRTLYTVAYVGIHGRQDIEFYFDPSDEGTIMIKSQPTIRWVKRRV